jgi:hypothetical protein
MSSTRHGRAGDRVLGTWDGRYRPRPGGAWGDCTIVDLSPGGAGILLPPSGAAVDDRVEVDIRKALGRWRPLVVRGSVRNAHTLPDGWRRIALQFTNARGRRRRTLERFLKRRR